MSLLFVSCCWSCRCRLLPKNSRRWSTCQKLEVVSSSTTTSSSLTQKGRFGNCAMMVNVLNLSNIYPKVGRYARKWSNKLSPREQGGWFLDDYKVVAICRHFQSFGALELILGHLLFVFCTLFTLVPQNGLSISFKTRKNFPKLSPTLWKFCRLRLENCGSSVSDWRWKKKNYIGYLPSQSPYQW